MKKRLSAKRHGSLALALAAFAVAGTAPVFAQSSGAWNAGISARSGTPYLHTHRSTSAALVPMNRCPLSLQNQTSIGALPMSVTCQKRL
ncbi:MAG: hypothetical protein WBX95_09475 [Xanthobacteraceae bacterium]